MKFKNPPFGLILAGGKSRRMNRDKANLSYFGKPQVEVAYGILKEFCPRVFVSCRPDQAHEEHLKSLPQIHDGHEEGGPLTGLVAAMEKFPGEAWVVLACDMPYFNRDALAKLMGQRDGRQMATAFWNEDGAFPEPLCTLYEGDFLAHIKSILGSSSRELCPKKILMKADIRTLLPEDPRWINNINTPEEWDRALKDLGGKP